MAPASARPSARKKASPASARGKSPESQRGKKKGKKSKSPPKGGDGSPTAVEAELEPVTEEAKAGEELEPVADDDFSFSPTIHPERLMHEQRLAQMIGKYQRILKSASSTDARYDLARCSFCSFWHFALCEACPRCGETTPSLAVGAAAADVTPTNAALSRGGLVNTLSDEQLAALRATATALCARGKGLLASDESAGPWLRAGHAEAKQISDTPENRAAYRSMLYTTPTLSAYISGVILHVETLYQSDAGGTKMVDLITAGGMLPGIKLDKGYDKAGLPNTASGPLGHPETWTKGLDDLDKRAAEAYAAGARFAKWRNVLQIDPASGLPSDLAIHECVTSLARYASSCQRAGLVPIVEPEIVPNGAHPIEVCAEVTERVLLAQFAALRTYGVYLEGIVLKPNMVKPGLAAPSQATPETVAGLTIGALKRSVPSEVPGIFFLSGETPLDEDNEEVASNNLAAMNKLYPSLPWHVSFSYGKALQKTTIVTWMGLEANVPAAQAALLNRAKANSDANQGTYVAGTCASVGVDGNVQMAGGAY